MRPSSNKNYKNPVSSVSKNSYHENQTNYLNKLNNDVNIDNTKNVTSTNDKNNESLNINNEEYDLIINNNIDKNNKEINATNSFHSNIINNNAKLPTNEIDEMNVSRIRDFINILEEHQIQCERERKFVDAEYAKQKVNQLKQVEKDKILNDLRCDHEEELNEFESEKRESVLEFNKEWDINLNELNNRFLDYEEKLNQQQQFDLNNKIEEFEKKYHPVIKPTSEILNLQKILDGLIRQKEYIKAHQIQLQIDKLSNIDNKAYIQEKERKLIVIIDKLKIKHSQEFDVLAFKRDLAERELNKNRKIQYDKLEQLFKNRLKEIIIKHNFEISQITNPKKYLARNLINNNYNKFRINNSKRNFSSANNITKNRLHSSSSMDASRMNKYYNQYKINKNYINK